MVLALLLFFVLCAIGRAQPTQLQVQALAPAAPDVSSISARTVGPAGAATLYYWIVARYPGGYSVQMVPAQAQRAPAVSQLSGSWFVRVTWAAVPGATGYDILRATSTVYPAAGGSCACAVVTNTQSNTVDDTGGVLGVFPSGGLQPAAGGTATITLDTGSAAYPFLNVGMVSRSVESLRMGLLSGFFNDNDCVKFSAGRLVSAGASCGSGGGGSPGGSNGQLQYNNAGAFGGAAWTVSGANLVGNGSVTGTGFIVNGAPGSNCILAGGTTGACGSGGASSSLTDVRVDLTSATLLTVQPGRWGFGNTSMSPHAGTTFSVATLTVTGSTGVGISPIVLVVSSMSAASLRNGDMVMVAGVSGNTNANGTFAVTKVDDTHLALNGTTGNGAYGGGGVVAGTGNGTAVLYANPQGQITIESPASAGVIWNCSSVCVMNQTTTPTVPYDGGVPISEVTIVSGQLTAVNDTRRFLNPGPALQAGTGFQIVPGGGILTLQVDGTVARTGATNVFTGDNSFGLATRTAPHRTASGAPAASCTVGDTYFRTDASAGQNQYLCTSTNTWTQVTSGGVANTFTASGGAWLPYKTMFCSSCATFTPAITNGQILCVETFDGAPAGTPDRINFYTNSNSFNVGWALYSSDGNTRIAKSTESAGATTAMVSQAFTPVLVAGTSYRLCFSADGNQGVLTVDSSGANVSQFLNTGATAPKMGRATNTVTWSAGAATWPAALGTLTAVNVGIPLVTVTKN